LGALLFKTVLIRSKGLTALTVELLAAVVVAGAVVLATALLITAAEVVDIAVVLPLLPRVVYAAQGLCQLRRQL